MQRVGFHNLPDLHVSGSSVRLVSGDIRQITRADVVDAAEKLQALHAAGDSTVRAMPEASNLTRITHLSAPVLGNGTALARALQHEVSVTTTGHYAHLAETVTVRHDDGSRLVQSQKRIWSGTDRLLPDRVETEVRMELPQDAQRDEMGMQHVAQMLATALLRVNAIISDGRYGVFEEANRYRRIKLAAAYSAMILPEADGFIYFKGTEPIFFKLDSTSPDFGIPQDLLSAICEEEFFIVYVPLKESENILLSEDDTAQITMVFRNGNLEEFSVREITHQSQKEGELAQPGLAVQNLSKMLAHPSE